MRHLVKVTTLVLLSLVSITGCVSSRVSGEKMAVPDQFLTQLGICLRQENFTDSNVAAGLGNKHVNELFPHLAERIPMAFGNSGIRSVAANCSGEQATVPPVLDGFSHILILSPKTALWNSYSGSTLLVVAEIFQRSNGILIWRGKISLYTKGHGSFDGGLADELANKLLIQMRKDGIIRAQIAATQSATPSHLKPVALAHRRQVPPDTGFAESDDFEKIPLSEKGKERYRYYLTLPSPKAFVIFQAGGWRFLWNDSESMTKALDYCAREGKQCWLYAVDDHVVWSADVDKRVGKSEQLHERP